MNRSPHTFWAAATTSLAIAASSALIATPATATADSHYTAPATHAAALSLPAAHSLHWPTVRSGSRGHAVVAAQHLLTARGHAAKADGVFGSRTAAAVRGFQKARKLRADGIVGPSTWKALITTVRSGSRGHAVVAVQHLLTARGHAVKADGAFGSRTAAAVRAFQKARKLRADGIVGPNTWNALLDAPSKPQPGPRGYYLKFTKNWQAPTRSKLSLVRDGKVVKSYRAGSGKGSTDECASNKGWLPSGTYQVKGHQTNRNSTIKGYAIQLADKACKPTKRGQKPVTRDYLFIHSEMLSNGRQAWDNPFVDDDDYRWNGDIDYQSLGCIKLTPGDIKDLFSRLNRAHWPKNLTLRVT
ncbi:peptidoglycan-binding protein [Actinacidiphila glaucinigra]|uniref:peptidoglycan-binding protein n=1 Tax=Actinacidiphila glaucinigra TaxID=235986 RepID=UPI0037CA451E